MAKRPIYVNWMTSIDRQARQAEKAIQEKAKYDQETERRMGLKKEKAGVVVYRTENQNEPTVLVVSARKYENQWVFPVGSVEKDETLEAAAMRECREESGYRVELGKRLPALQIEGNHQMKRFTFFLATVIGEVGQWETDRERKWLPLSQVVQALPSVFQGIAREAVAQISR